MVIDNMKWCFLSLVLLILSCTSVQHISTTNVNYKVVHADSIREDERINKIIAPYKIQLDSVMNEVLVELPVELTKQKPESTLGNLVADVIVERLKKNGYEVDFAVVNYGGLRVPYLTAGPLTRGEVFELSPFDNTLMIVDVPGIKLDSFLLLIAENDGWPISKEAKLNISNKKVISAHISGEPVNPTKIYKVATLDYVATGGDNMKVLIPLDRVDTGLLFRDVLIEYFKEATASGKKINSVIDGRIIKS